MKRLLCMITALLIAASPMTAFAEERGVMVTLDATESVSPSPTPTPTQTPEPANPPKQEPKPDHAPDQHDYSGEQEDTEAVHVSDLKPTEFPPVRVEWVEVTPEQPAVVFQSAMSIHVTKDNNKNNVHENWLDATDIITDPKPEKSIQKPETINVQAEVMEEQDHFSVFSVVIVSLAVSVIGGLAGIYISKRLYKRQ